MEIVHFKDLNVKNRMDKEEIEQAVREGFTELRDAYGEEVLAGHVFCILCGEPTTDVGVFTPNNDNVEIFGKPAEGYNTRIAYYSGCVNHGPYSKLLEEKLLSILKSKRC